MYKFLFLFIPFFIINSLFSQAQLSVSTKFFLNDYQKELLKSQTDKRFSTSFVESYDLYQKRGHYYIGALLMIDKDAFNKSDLEELEVVVSTQLSKMLSVRVPIQNLEALMFVSGIQYIETGETVSPDLNRSLYDTRVDSVHAGLGDLEMPYDGEGVIIAIIDWGFDYTHPMFYDTSLTNLRLSRAWDQNKMAGPPPVGYDFGTEYVGTDALLEAEQDTLYVFGPGSHGTHVAGIAGGCGAGEQSKGIAPGAELIFISLRRDAPSLTDAYNYVHNYAESVNKRYVVNMSFGSHLGPHDGSSLKNMGIDEHVAMGGVAVGSAGNNGDANFHLSRNFAETNDTLSTVINFQSIADSYGTTLSMWGSEGTGFEVKLIAANNSMTSVNVFYETDFFNSNDEPYLDDTIIINGNERLIIRMQATSQTFFNNKPNIRMELRREGSFRVAMLVTSPNSHVHIWSNVRMNNRYTNWGVPLTNNFISSEYPIAVGGDTDYGLGEPGGVGKSVITVASHIPDVLNENTGNVTSGNLSTFSSIGPTVDERVKPDISGPGQNILSSVNSFDPSTTNNPIKVEFNGKEYPFDRFSGTSMSGPAVAGVVALMLQANDYLTATQIRNVIKETARLDDRTGEIGEEGTLNWGWGKINALAAVKVAEELPNFTSIQIAPNHVKIYPNPTQQILNIEGVTYNSVKIFDMGGKLVQTFEHSNHNKLPLNVSKLNAGLYLIQIATQDHEAIFHKFIKE